MDFVLIMSPLPVGVSVTSSNSGVPDISGTVYNKTQVRSLAGYHVPTMVF